MDRDKITIRDSTIRESATVQTGVSFTKPGELLSKEKTKKRRVIPERFKQKSIWQFVSDEPVSFRQSMPAIEVKINGHDPPLPKKCTPSYHNQMLDPDAVNPSEKNLVLYHIVDTTQ